MRRIHLLATALAVASLSPAENLSARREFYQAYPAQQGRAWVGLKTSILLRTEGANRVCQFREVPEDFEFREGDRFRVRMQANAAGYLYVVARDGQGSFRLLYPSGTGADATSYISRFETRMVPELDWFGFDARAGSERMYVFFSPERMKEFEKLVMNPGKPLKSGDLQKLVDRADGKSSGSLEESGPDGDIGATYAVSEVNWKSEAVLRRFRFRNYGR